MRRPTHPLRLSLRTALASGLVAALVAAGVATGVPTGATPTAHAEPARDPGAALATAFRSTLGGVDVALRFLPARDRVRGSVRLDARLRGGQDRLLFHFNPSRTARPGAEKRMIRDLRLDGRRLDPATDLRIIRPAAGAEPAFEVTRDLPPGSRHRLEVRWTAPVPPAPRGVLRTDFDDTEGPRGETETMWPTVSSPEVQARHRVRVTVASPRAYRVLGSGSVRREGPRRWLVDTGRPVASHTVFVAAVPAAGTTSRDVRVAGVTVRLVSDRSPAVVRTAVRRTRTTVRRLERDLGPFPVDRVDVLLTGWGSGMEYYGATRTGIAALTHELGHMYFGTTTVNRTWRDTWIHEATVSWWAEKVRRPLPRGWTSRMAAGRPVAAPGFDLRAYGRGAQLLATLSRVVGGRQRTLDFLADLHARRMFRPFTTQDLIDDVVAFTDGRLPRARLERWLLTPDR